MDKPFLIDVRITWLGAFAVGGPFRDLAAESLTPGFRAIRCHYAGSRASPNSVDLLLTIESTPSKENKP